MPRIIKEPAARRNDILDVALRLVYSIGYEQMTIQDILDDLQISKGAFYHYFDSKDTLLEALIDRIASQVEQTILPIVNDPVLPAIEKLQRYFDTAVQWKTTRKELVMALMRVWYIDENAILRQKVVTEGYKTVIPLLTRIVHQGLREGTLNMPYPDHAAEIIFSMLMGLGERIARLLLSATPEADNLTEMANLLAAYTYALERVLAVTPGTFTLMEPELLKKWLTFSEEPVT